MAVSKRDQKGTFCKKDFTADRRTNAKASIRRKRKKMFLAKRRKQASLLSKPKLAGESMTPAFGTEFGDDSFGSGFGTPMKEEEWTLEQVKTYAVDFLGAKDVPALTTALKNIRRLLSLIENPPITEFIQAKIVARLTNLLKHENDEVKVEASWCIMNIASGTPEETKHILPAVPYLSAYLEGSSAILQEHASWAIGNIAAEEQWRQKLFKMGVIQTMGGLLRSKYPPVVRVAAWALSNLARGEQTSAIPFFKAGVHEHLLGLMKSKDKDIVLEVSWVLSYLTAREEKCVEALVAKGILVSLVGLINAADDTVTVTPLLRSLGNIIAIQGEKSERWSMWLLTKTPVLKRLISIMTNKKHRVVCKEVAWVISNLASGTSAHRVKLVESGALPVLVRMFLGSEYETRREIAFALDNLARDKRILLEMLKNQDLVPSMLALLSGFDVSLLRVAVHFIGQIAEHVPGGMELVQSHDGAAKIERIAYMDTDPGLCRAATELVDRFYGAVDEDEEADANAGLEGATSFPFGVDSPPTSRRPTIKPAWATKSAPPAAAGGGSGFDMSDFGL